MNTPLPHPETPADGDTGVPVVYVQPVDDRGTPLAPPRELADIPVAVWDNVPVRNPKFTGREDVLRQFDELLSAGPQVVLLQFLGHRVERSPLPEAVPPWPVPGALSAWEGLFLPDVCGRGTDFLRVQLERARARVVLAGPAGADEWLQTIGTPRSELWREAAATVLLDAQWTQPGPDEDPVAYFKKRLRRAVRQWRWSWERQLNHRSVGLLSEPRYLDGQFAGTVADTLASGADVEASALDAVALTGDPCMLRVMAKLSPRETRIADLYARDPGLSWEEAAALAGEREPRRAGDSLSHRLLELGRQHMERARAARHTAGRLLCHHGRLETATGGARARRLGRELEHVRRDQNAQGAPSGPGCPHSPEPVPGTPRT
ncbi:hypothetical protein ACIBMX_47055 [Streptomyces phaeochromogenes]|uniref:hypothetical protein n=1 Tax=Streptomyces phaeochromogenes TaxID=1923 RepID=UPI00340A7A0F